MGAPAAGNTFLSFLNLWNKSLIQCILFANIPGEWWKVPSTAVSGDAERNCIRHAVPLRDELCT